MSKNLKIIALVSCIGWLAFIFAAFRGYHFWYEGFVVLFWVFLGILNYDQHTSLWLLRNKLYSFFVFYIFLFAFFFFVDFIVAQKLTNLWYYPYHNSPARLIEIYLLYPFSGLPVLELVYFISSIFNEKLNFVKEPFRGWHKLIDYLEIASFPLVVLLPLLLSILRFNYIADVLVWGFIFWLVIATVKFKYHIKHWFHFVAIFIVTAIISIFLNEIPNVGTYEWIYNDIPISLLNRHILGVPLWIQLGWYIFVLLMLKFWMYFVLKNRS